MDSEVQNLIQKDIDYLAGNTKELLRLTNICMEKKILTQNEADEIHKTFKIEYEQCTYFYQAIQKKIKGVGDLHDIFHRSGNTHLIERLKISSCKNPQDRDRIWFEVPSLGKNFVGRNHELESIHKEYEESLKTNRLAVVAITGLGGQGKSELAKRFAQEFLEKWEGHCVWIHADKLNILGSIQRFAESIKIPLEAPNKKEKRIRELSRDIAEYFKNQRRLFIFDNIENFEDAVLKEVLETPKGSDHPLVTKPLIIFTSRSPTFTKALGLDVRSVPLESLSPDHAVTFVKQSLEIEDSNAVVHDKVQTICEQLHYYPLALTQAVYYIKSDNGSPDAIINNVSEYIALLKKDRKKALLFPAGGDVEKNVCKSLGITLEKLNKPTEEVLNCISFFYRENIHTKMVANILSKSEEEITEAFKSLCKYTVCTKTTLEEHPDYFSIHPMVQEVCNCNMSNNDILETIVTSILKIMGQTQQEFVKGKDMMHLQAIWDHVAKDRELKLKYISLPSKISKAYYTFAGNYRYGYEFSCKVAKDLGNYENPDDTVKAYYLKMLYWKGNFLQKIGDFAEALKVLEDVLNWQLDLPKQNDKKMLWTRYSIGVVKMRLAKLNEAMDIFSLVHCTITAKSKSDDEEYKDLLMEVENEKASVLFNQCKYNESLDLYDNTSSKIKDLGKNHTSTLNTKHCIGMLKFYQGYYSDALEIFKEVTEVAEAEQLRRDCVQAKCWMSRCLRLLEKFDDALELGNTVLKEKVKIFGENHINVLGTRQNIATIYFDKQDFEEALKQYDAILNVAEKVLDPKYPLLLLTKHSKAATLRALGRYDDALTLAFPA